MSAERAKIRRQVQQESLSAAYVSAVRTAVRNNSSAYGFSVAATGSYGLAATAQGNPGLLSVLLFVLGVGTAFVTTELVVSRVFTRQIDSDAHSVVAVANAINVLSMGGAVAVAYGSAQAPGGVGWFLAGLTATATYLVVGGLDVLFARLMVQRTGRTSGE